MGRYFFVRVICHRKWVGYLRKGIESIRGEDVMRILGQYRFRVAVDCLSL